MIDFGNIDFEEFPCLNICASPTNMESVSYYLYGDYFNYLEVYRRLRAQSYSAFQNRCSHSNGTCIAICSVGQPRKSSAYNGNFCQLSSWYMSKVERVGNGCMVLLLDPSPATSSALRLPLFSQSCSLPATSHATSGGCSGVNQYSFIILQLYVQEAVAGALHTSVVATVIATDLTSFVIMHESPIMSRIGLLVVCFCFLNPPFPTI